MYSIQTAVSDGNLTMLALSIDYPRRDYIHVYFDGVEQAEGSTWQWVGVSDKAIIFSPAVGDGVVVRVQRITPLDTVPNIYGSAEPPYVGNAEFDADTVDENFRQTLQVAQESVDRTDEAISASQDAINTSIQAQFVAAGAVNTANAAALAANDAHNIATGIDAKAQQALDDSAYAVNTANAIAGTANDALNTAQNAELIVSGAQDDATEALNTANSIAGVAQDALDTAEAAEITANNAASAAANAAQKSANLSDLASASAARTNLGLGTAATADVGNTGSQLPTATQVQAMIPAPPGDATTTTKGVVELATPAEVEAGSSSIVVVTPSGFAAAMRHSNYAATTTQRGNVQLATAAEATALTNSNNAITPSTFATALRSSAANASTSVRGSTTYATAAQALAGSSNSTAITPNSLLATMPAAQWSRGATYSSGQVHQVAMSLSSQEFNRGGFTYNANGIVVPTPGLYLCFLRVSADVAVGRLFGEIFPGSGSDFRASTEHDALNDWVDTATGMGIVNFSGTTTSQRTFNVNVLQVNSSAAERGIDVHLIVIRLSPAG